MNHAFVTVPGSIGIDRLEVFIQEIVARRFKDLLTVEKFATRFWKISYSKESFLGVTIEVLNRRKMSFRRSIGGDFTGWVQSVLQDELGAKLKGRCSDEGICETWLPDTELYPNFRSFFDVLHKEFLKPDMLEKSWTQCHKQLPKALRAL